MSEQLYVWKEDFDEIIRQIPDDERHQSPHGSVYSSPHCPVDPRSPYLTRSRKLILEQDDEPGGASFRSDTSSEDPGDTTSTVPDTPTRVTTAKRKRASTANTSGHGATRPATSGQRQVKAYCTMKCLVGLRLRRSLDPTCPNYAQHRLSPDTFVHEIGLNDLVERVRCQLNADVDHNCDPLGIQGARGVLFRVTEVSHGYTFVAKGTIDEYRQATPPRGASIPAPIAHPRLRDSCPPGEYRSRQSLLLRRWSQNFSHGFDVLRRVSLHERSPAIEGSLLDREKQRSMREVSQLSVVHGDLRLPNMLWNDEVHRVLLIDFERAHIQQQKRKRGHHSNSEILHLRSLKTQRRQDLAAGHPLHLMQSISTCT